MDGVPIITVLIPICSRRTRADGDELVDLTQPQAASTRPRAGGGWSGLRVGDMYRCCHACRLAAGWQRSVGAVESPTRPATGAAKIIPRDPGQRGVAWRARQAAHPIRKIRAWCGGGDPCGEGRGVSSRRIMPKTYPPGMAKQEVPAGCQAGSPYSRRTPRSIPEGAFCWMSCHPAGLPGPGRDLHVRASAEPTKEPHSGDEFRPPSHHPRRLARRTPGRWSV